MSEKRKPDFILLLKKKGKRTNKVEAFNRELWEPNNAGTRYRLRVNGKWWPEGKKQFFTKTEFKELFFRAIK